MKRTLLTLFVLSLATVFAQTEDAEAVASGNYGVVMTTFTAFEGQFGFGDVLAPQADLRLRLGIAPNSGFGANVGADAIFELGRPSGSGFYAGSGLSIGFGNNVNYIDTGIALLGTLGYEIALERAGIITELGTGIGYRFGEVGGLYPTGRLALGVKFDL